MIVKILATGEIGYSGDLFPNVAFPYGRPQLDWMVENGVEEVVPEPVIYHSPTAEEVQEQIILSLVSAMEHHYDTVAQKKKYDNRLTCALRAGYAGPFQQEGITFAVWMDNCNAYAYNVMADCLKEIRTIPTPEQLVSELPPDPW